MDQSNKSQPLVSVVIPTYKRPVYLKRAIDSVLNQTYSNVEAIVVDDNNPDTDDRRETEQMMLEYKDNPRVTYIRQERNQGGSVARNAGWRVSRAEYITFLDDDDELIPERTELQVKCLEELDGSWGMCYTGYTLTKEDGSHQTSSETRSGYLYPEALMRTLFMGSGSNLFLRKKVVDEVNGYDERFKRNQDLEFLARTAENYKIAYIDKPLFIIRREGYRAERPYEEFVAINDFYIQHFRDRIDALGKKDSQRVYAVIYLECFRGALRYRKPIEGIRILIKNRVPIKYQLKYVGYMLDRAITHKSYGFSG